MKGDGNSEAMFVIECVRRALDPSTGDGANESVPTIGPGEPSSLDWTNVVTIARRNAVSPLVYESLKSCPDAVPESIRAELREEYRTNAKRNLAMAGALHEILQEFRERNIRAIPFKGPVLAEFGYGDLNRRRFLDLDILVVPADRTQADAVVQELGYERSRPTHRRIRDSSVVQRSRTEYEYKRPTDDMVVELRWEFSMDRLPAVETLWQRRATHSVAGNAVPVLSPTDRFLVLTTHATKHCCRRLAWIADVAVTVDSVEDWNAVLETLSEHPCGQWVSVSLRLAEALFDVAVPRTFWADPNVPAGSAIAEEMHDKWLRNPIDTTSELDEFRFHARLQSPRELAGELLDVGFRPRPIDYDAVPLPTPLHPLYYVLRPLRLAVNLPRYRSTSPE